TSSCWLRPRSGRCLPHARENAPFVARGRVLAAIGICSMAQLFRPEATTAFRFGLIAAILIVLAILAGAYLYLRSDWFWRIGDSAAQPIPFRHDLHVAGIGIAC